MRCCRVRKKEKPRVGQKVQDTESLASFPSGSQRFVESGRGKIHILNSDQLFLPKPAYLATSRTILPSVYRCWLLFNGLNRYDWLLCCAKKGGLGRFDQNTKGEKRKDLMAHGTTLAESPTAGKWPAWEPLSGPAFMASGCGWFLLHDPDGNKAWLFFPFVPKSQALWIQNITKPGKRQKERSM